MSSYVNLNKRGLVILMDLDGTICSEDIHFKVYRDILKKYNIDFTKEDYVEGTTNEHYGGKCTNYLVATHRISPEQAKQISSEKKISINSYGEDIQLIPNADAFIEAALQITDKVAVVSNSAKDYIEFVKEKQPILQRIQTWITREDCTYHKPHPEPYWNALKRFNINETNKGDYTILGIENSLLGIQAIRHVSDHVFGCVYNYSNKTTYNNVRYFSNYDEIFSNLTSF